MTKEILAVIFMKIVYNVKIMKNRGLSFILVMCFVLSIMLSSNNVYTIEPYTSPEDVESPELKAQYYATSPTDFFNETTYPRYKLAARPIGKIKYPNKANPSIITFGGHIQVMASSSADTSNWNFTLIDDNVSLSLDIIKSEYKDNKWFFDTIPEINREGLYDLQLNCSTGSDYQTHAIQLLEEQTYPFTFAHVSDAHFPAYYEEFNTSDVNLETIANIKAEDPDFIVVTGDLIHAATRYFLNPENDEPMSSEMQYKLAIWALDLFDKPVFYIYGNHEFIKTTYLPDDPGTQYYKYFGDIVYQNFTYLDWSFVGYGAEWAGLSQADYDKVFEILSQNSDNGTVLYYHYDFAGHASSFIKKFPIELALYGHEHIEDLYMKKNTLYHLQAPLFEHEYTIISVLNETGIEIDGVDFNFTLVPYVPPIITPTPTPTETTTITSESIGFGSLFTIIGLIVYYLKRRKY